MNIIVCIKQVPGTTKVQIDEETGSLIRDGVDSRMNPFDLFALETALRIKEKISANITVISMGPPKVKEIIQEAFFIGDIDGIILSDRHFAGADCLATAYALSQCIQKVSIPDLIICGRQTTDGDTAQVGPELAEFLGIPHITNVTRIIKVRKDNITVEADLQYSLQTAEISYPALITVAKDIYQPRLPSYRRKLQIADLCIQQFDLKYLIDQEESHYGLAGSPTRVIRIFPPKQEQKSEVWTGDESELALRLYEVLTTEKYV